MDSEGAIATSGDYSNAIQAYSIGGGGGSAGDTGAMLYAMGGTGRAGGHGGAVSVTNNNDLDTAGLDAVGIFAQSIGGGGGDVPLKAFISVGGDCSGTSHGGNKKDLGYICSNSMLSI